MLMLVILMLILTRLTWDADYADADLCFRIMPLCCGYWKGQITTFLPKGKRPHPSIFLFNIRFVIICFGFGFIRLHLINVLGTTDNLLKKTPNMFLYCLVVLMTAYSN